MLNTYNDETSSRCILESLSGNRVASNEDTLHHEPDLEFVDAELGFLHGQHQRKKQHTFATNYSEYYINALVDLASRLEKYQPRLLEKVFSRVLNYLIQEWKSQLESRRMFQVILRFLCLTYGPVGGMEEWHQAWESLIGLIRKYSEFDLLPESGICWGLIWRSIERLKISFVSGMATLSESTAQGMLAALEKLVVVNIEKQLPLLNKSQKEYLKLCDFHI